MCFSEYLGADEWAFSSGLPLSNQVNTLNKGEDEFLYAGLNGEVVYKTERIVTVSHNLKKDKKDVEVIIQPNPVNEIMQIEIIPGQNNLEGVWQLKDLQGRSLMHGSNHSNKFTIKTKELPIGLYVLKFSDYRLPTKKLVIQH